MLVRLDSPRVSLALSDNMENEIRTGGTPWQTHQIEVAELFLNAIAHQTMATWQRQSTEAEIIELLNLARQNKNNRNQD